MSFNVKENLPSEVREQRECLMAEIDEIFAVNREARAQLAREKPEGWERRFYELNDDTVSRLDRAMQGGLLRDFPKLFTDEELRPKSPEELGGSEVAPGDYRKIESGRTKEFIVFIFRWGPKSEDKSKEEGAETPVHGHLPSSCSLTPYFPGNDEERYATVSEVVIKNGQQLVHTPIQSRLSTVGGRKEFDDHVVFNGHPTKAAYTVHVYPIEIIRDGEVVTLAEEEIPGTAPGARAVFGGIDPKTHERVYGAGTRADVQMAVRPDGVTSKNRS